jgi:hypothetical protein
MIRFLKILEIVWLSFGAILLGFAVFKSVGEGIEATWYYYVFPVVCAFMYYWRRRERVRLEKDLRERNTVKE